MERITELHRDTIMKLLVQVGGRYEDLVTRIVRNVPVKDVQWDEIWSFVGKKESHKGPKERRTI